MTKPCKRCPFRHDVKPFLHPLRGEELAYHTQNPYNTFTCHSTIEFDEDDYGEYISNPEATKVCAGFMTLQYNENGNTLPKGWEPSYDLVYEDVYDMIDAYNPDNISFDEEDIE